MPLALDASADLATVGFGLLSAIAFGAGDFGGGLTSRRAPVFGVVLVVQVVGLLVSPIIAALRGEPIPSGPDLAFAASAGVAGGLGIVALYRGLAEGRIGVVAPITGVLAAVVPVVFGVVLEGLPGPGVLIGMSLALVAVVLVSTVADDAGRPSAVRLALAAGFALGAFNVLISQVSAGSVFGPIAVVRLVELGVIGAIIVVGRRAWRVPRAWLPAAIGVAVLDTAGNVGFLMARQAGRLDVAAVTSSLYPVVTLILAVAILHERVGRQHALGIAAAAVGIVLIAAGSAN